MRLLSKYELFIFDWDHTLTTSTIFVTLLDLFGARGKHRSMEMLRGKRYSDFPARNIRMKEDVSRIYSMFDDAYGVIFRPRLKRGAIPLLSLLKRNGRKVAVFSDSRSYRLLKETEQLGALRYVDTALAAEAVGRYKPNPTGLLVLLDRFKAKKERSVYIGDMASDIMTAKLAGMHSCAVADGIDSFDALKNERPDHLFSSLESFLQALQEERKSP